MKVSGRRFGLFVAMLFLLLGRSAGWPALAQVSRSSGGGGPANAPRPPLQTSVSLWVGRDVAPGPKIRLSLNTRNVPAVSLAAYKLDAAGWLLRREQGGEQSGRGARPTPLAPKPALTWTVPAAPPGFRPAPGQRDVYRSRQINLPKLPPGVYLLVAAGGGKQAWSVVNITNLAVIVKRAPRRLLAWVTDNESGAPVVGARVRLFARSGARVVAAGATRADGTCLLSAPPSAAETLLVERTGGGGRPDVAGLPVGVENPDGRLASHFQTDRPVYRPGQTVFWKTILRRTRGRGYVLVANAPCRVEVRDAKENVLQSEMMTTNALGTLSGQTNLPAEGVLGPYSVVVTQNKDSVYGQFTVAEYRKPEFKVSVSPAAPRYLAGEKAAFLVQAAYYFGAPLAQAEVVYQIRRAPAPFAFVAGADESERWYAGGDGNLYARDTYDAAPFVAEGTVYTDAAGRATIPFNTQAGVPDSTYNVTVTVRDAQRRQVEGAAGVPVYAAALRLGLRTDLVTVPLGGLIPLDLRIVDRDNKPAPARVTLITRHQVWVEKKNEYQTRELSRTRVNVSAATGRARASVPVLAPGEVEIVAMTTDSTGRKTSATLSIYVADPNARPERETKQPQVQVRLDRRGAYRPGDVAKIFVTTNTPARPLLVTAEGADVFGYAVVPKGQRTFSWRLPTTLAMSPNAHVDVVQWARPAQMVSANAVLPVPDTSRRLRVSVEPDRTTRTTGYRPGDEAAYVVRTLGDNGRPVSADVSLAVVDEAIFAVRPDATPDPYTVFWGLRPNLTQTRVSAPEEVSGGAYQRNNALAPVRERFLDTAFWNAHVVTTGADGTARVRFSFPGNLTTWRATALAVTEGTQVGRTQTLATVSRPVLLRLGTPRQIVQGDELRLTGTVNNRTNAEREFAVTLGAENFALDSGSATQTVRVPAGGERTVTWRLRAPTLPESHAGTLSGEVRAATLAPGEALSDLSDRLRVSVPIVPRGIAQRRAAGTVVSGTGAETVTLNLPDDRIEPATDVRVSVQTGLGQVAQNAARAVLETRPWGTEAAADQLAVAAALGPANVEPRIVRDALALLSRFQNGSGAWGLWENAPDDPYVTARVVAALAQLKNAGVPAGVTFPANLLQRGVSGAEQLYNQTNLWEHRARLAEAIFRANGQSSGARLLSEVARRGTDLSPDALLVLAGVARANDAALQDLRPAFVIGPDTAYLPAGSRPGWRATTGETTARALLAALALPSSGDASDLAAKLARYLARPDDEGDDYRTTSDNAAVAVALLAYVRAHPDPATPGDIALAVNGTPVPVPNAPAAGANKPFTVAVPRGLLRSGDNTFTLRREGGGAGEVFVFLSATLFRPALVESQSGMRILRRWEAPNAFGTWDEVPSDGTGTIKPSTPVRVTVVVWPDDKTDALRVTQPIPAGFEFVDSELGSAGAAREEIRDGAVAHYLRAEGEGRPLTFRYYLRAESDGRLLALPATGEVLRRPHVRGNSSAQPLTVTAAETIR